MTERDNVVNADFRNGAKVDGFKLGFNIPSAFF